MDSLVGLTISLYKFTAESAARERYGMV